MGLLCRPVSSSLQSTKGGPWGLGGVDVEPGVWGVAMCRITTPTPTSVIKEEWAQALE